MHSEQIDGMLKVLRPGLKNSRKARTALERYWRNQMALVWTLQQVHRAANERSTALNNEEAREILQQLFRQHDAQYGVRWSDLTERIDQSGAGRKLTRRELRAFIENDQIIIQK